MLQQDDAGLPLRVAPVHAVGRGQPNEQLVHALATAEADALCRLYGYGRECSDW